MRILFAVLSIVACGDNDSPAPWTLPDLVADEGFSVRVPQFDVAAGTEIQDCYFFTVPDLADGADLWFDKYEIGLTPGSHHMNVFRTNTIVGLDPKNGTPVDLGGVQGVVIRGADDRACWKSSNWADWPLVVNSQQSNADQQVTDWTLPAGVAARFAPGEQLMLQVHYVNSTDQPAPWGGHIGVNFYRSKEANSVELGTVFATQQSIRVCRSDPQPRYSGACAMPAGTHTIFGANGHFHSRGTRLRMWSWDGVSTTVPPTSAMFYDNTTWDDPVMATQLDVALPESGGGVWWECDYQWQPPSVGCDAIDAADPLHAGDCCYTFGPNVETNEHCNIFAYYYPAVARSSVTCF
jgi:hypothetical protein